MAWVYIEELGRHMGEEVTLKGWLYNRRSSGKVHFLLIRDGTGVCQCVASLNDVGAEASPPPTISGRRRRSKSPAWCARTSARRVAAN